MKPPLALPDSEDTALARVLHREGVLPLEVIQEALAEVRRRRVEAPGATLAGTLLARGALSGEELDRIYPRLGLTRAAPGPALLPGKALGPYRLVREIARGGMGVVYEAVHEATQVPCALKTLLVGQGADPEEVARFHREAAAQGRLAHPNVARVLASDVFGRTPYLVQELLPGGTLQERARRSPLAPGEAVEVARALAAGLAHCHQAGILHRDLKPENVLFDAGGVPKLVDFGLAFSAEASQRLTATGALLGTPAYMAPEQALGLKDLDARTDVYGLGAILYFLLCGRAPFAGGLFQVLEQVVSAPPEPPRAISPEVAPGLEAVCLRALAKDPAERFADMESFAAALAAEAGPSAGEAASRGGRGLAVVGGLLVLGVLALGVALATPRSSTASPAALGTPLASSPEDTRGATPASPAASSPAPVEGLGPLLERWGPGPGALSYQGYDLARIGSQVLTLERHGGSSARLNAEVHSKRPGVVRIWSLEDGIELGRLDLSGPTPLEPLRMERSRDGGRIAVAGKRAVAVYETEGWSCVGRFERAAAEGVEGLALSPSGKSLAICSGRKGERVRVWDWNGLVQDLPFCGRALAFVDEGTLAVVARNKPDPQGRMVFWSVGGERELARQEHPALSEAMDLEVSRDGKRLFVACWKEGVAAWDLVGEPAGWRMGAATSVGVEVTRVRLDPRERVLLATTGRRDLFVVDPATLEFRSLGRVPERSARDALPLRDGRVLTVGTGYRLRLLSQRLRPLWSGGTQGPLGALGRSERGVLVASGEELRILGGERLDLRLGLPLDPLPLVQARLNEGGSRAWCALGKWLGVFELTPEGPALRGRFGFADRASGLAIDSAGEQGLALLSRGGRVFPSRVALREKALEVDALDKSPLMPQSGWFRIWPPALHVTASGLAVLGDERGALQTWGLEGLELREGLPGGARRKEVPAIVTLASVGDLILAGDERGRIRRWRPGSKELDPLRGHAGPVFDLCVLPGGRLASVAEDGDLVIWDLEKGWQLTRRRIEVGVPHLLHYGRGVLTVATTSGHVQAFEFR